MRFIIIVAAILLINGLAFAEMQNPKDAYPYFKDNTATGLNRGNLDCSNVIELEWDVTQTHTTVGAPSNVDTYPCTTWDESGPELVFHITSGTAGRAYEFQLSVLDGADLDLIIIQGSACDEDNCAEAFDTQSPIYPDEPGDVYIIVDGYNGAAGAFEITAIAYLYDDWTNACFDYLTPDYPVGGGIVDISVNTCETNLNHIEASDCFIWDSAGLDVYYEITLFDGASVQATGAFPSPRDAILYIVDTCENQSDGTEPTFLACADETLGGGSETVTYLNETGQEQTVYLVIDSYGADTCDLFAGYISVDPCCVATETVNWGAVKSLYRQP